MPRILPKPTGIYWDKLSPQKLESRPFLVTLWLVCFCFYEISTFLILFEMIFGVVFGLTAGLFVGFLSKSKTFLFAPCFQFKRYLDTFIFGAIWSLHKKSLEIPVAGDLKKKKPFERSLRGDDQFPQYYDQESDLIVCVRSLQPR